MLYLCPQRKKIEIKLIIFTFDGLSENTSIRHKPTGCEQTTFTNHLHSKNKNT